MTRAGSRRGFSVVELLAALGLGLAIAVAAVSATATALRHLTRLALRAEADDLLALALEAFTLDVRRAGFDPRNAGIVAVIEASTTRLRLQADLDGDGTIDATSEELTTIVCDVPGGRLSRVIGTQSLPLANGVSACAFDYADDAGVRLSPPPGGLDAVGRSRIRRTTLDVALLPPGSAVATPRSHTVALRSRP
jgi:Tfp pilus assembly protein PilW